jgi:UPF0716 protein FxsA
MNPFQLVFLCFLIVPFIEIYLLLQIGGIVGVMPTVFLVVFTAVLGGWLLRQQGLATIKRFQDNLAQGAMPAFEMIEGPILLVGGALLLTPGFFTDVVGFACLIPQARQVIARYIIEKHLMQQGSPFQTRKTEDQNVIEGEFSNEDDSK